MISDYDATIADFTQGIGDYPMWGRLAWQDVKRRYRRTVVGPFWHTLSLGLFIVLLGIVWAQLWRQDPRAYLPFLCAGMLTWTLVSGILSEGCLMFVASESLIKQLRFPYPLLSCSVVLRNGITFLHNLIVLVGVMIYGGVPVTWHTLLVVPGLALIGVNGLWATTLLGIACARFRDIQQLVATLLQVCTFVTPIFFTPDQLGPRWALLVNVNPLFHYIEIVRGPLLGRAPALSSWAIVVAGTLVGWAMTLWIYARYARRVPYWI